ncbi:MAG: methylated-DNA--[protein]-cysteine S-methyltransferase [Leptolyngbya sp. SIO4C1]|nr:methylated-DNA--[protein]-cysteine S-methyltransferase [Leptolyngbya sp. SIO4C1]
MITSQTHTQTDYQRIAEAIDYLRSHYSQQPDLAAVARQVNLSESHFQRLFTQWAGISPKRFLQYLTVEYAKSQIAQTQNLLDLTAAAGLSSPGRLHDLFVTLEAMSPGEYKSQGRGLEIYYGLHDSPLGPLLIATTTRGICNLQFLASASADPAQQLRQDWPQAELTQATAQTRPIADRLFELENPRPVALLVKGTNFQIQVWRALLKIPLGGLVTYQGLAQQLGRPTAARAVGSAVGKNPIAYLIPCHRVIRASGELGGYRWGLSQKAMLLGWEASRAEAQDR